MIVRKPTNGIYVGTVKIGDYCTGKYSINDYNRSGSYGKGDC